MFGEYEDRVVLKRQIRDFAINNKEDLVSAQRGDPDSIETYSDVAMQYLPASAAFALADLAPLLREGRDVQVTLASELTPDRMKTNDIIYVGLLSGLGPLRDPVRNIWVIEFGMIACLMVIPFALIMGPIRGIPPYWRLIDCSFGVVGIVPLFICWKAIKKLEGLNAA